MVRKATIRLPLAQRAGVKASRGGVDKLTLTRKTNQNRLQRDAVSRYITNHAAGIMKTKAFVSDALTAFWLQQPQHLLLYGMRRPLLVMSCHWQ